MEVQQVISELQPIRLFVFIFVALFILAGLLGVLLPANFQTGLLFLLIISFGTLVYQILVLGKKEDDGKAKTKTTKDETGDDGVVEESEVDVEEDEQMLDNTPFGWVNAMKCDEVERSDQQSQCEYDGFTLQQQLGGFGDWISGNPENRQVYAKDYKRLRRDRCNLFQREDLQTACKLEPLGNF